MSAVRFTKDHEWVRLDGDSAVCGITDYAQKALGDIVYVELPAVGKTIKQAEQVAVVESAKAASEVYAPIDGEVTAANDDLATDPGKVNSDPAGGGWFFKLKPTNRAQVESLMNEADYHAYVKGLLAG